MVYVPYHSGSASAEQEKALAELAAPALEATLAPVSGPALRITFGTDAFRPSHRVTLRNADDGWERDVYGVYRDGAWVFELPRERYGATLACKLLLDGEHWMTGPDLQLPTDRDHQLGGVTFAAADDRPLLGYDNLRIEEGIGQQERMRANHRQDRTYDVVVIGSGFGGGVLADALSDLGRSVLVLEAGSLVYPSHTTNLPGDWPALANYHQVGNFANEPGSDFLFGVQMNLGGRSVFWSGLIPRMRDWELQFWPAPVRAHLAGVGYPQAEALLRKRRTLGPFQRSTVQALAGRFPDHLVTDLPQSLHQPNLGPGDQLGNVLEYSTGIFSTADLLLDSLAHGGRAGRDNLTVNLNHYVLRLERSGDAITDVVTWDLVGGAERRYRGRVVVLAAGSLESPRIVQRSGLPNPNGKVGRGLTDHPAFFSREYRLPPGGPFGGLTDHAKILLSHRQASFDQHGYNVEVLINPKYWDVRHSDDDVRAQNVDSDTDSGVRLQFVLGSHLDDANTITDVGAGTKARVRVGRNLTGSHLFGEVQNLRNEIVGFLGADPFDPQEGMHFGNEGTPHHAGGTLRMSGDGSGVVDTDLRFEGLDNLYVADNSVVPFIAAANPALTLSALSMRLAGTLHALL